MKTEVDERLRREAAAFRLRFTCEDCAHFAEPEGTCAHGYPAAPHRALDLAARTTLEFCKEFELV
ncbi:MAG TPA: hypothetical protein VMI54_26570 [Polyangiaceae bacterium]|nr:hypothetical protein [Polyangiaceae bacterium]